MSIVGFGALRGDAVALPPEIGFLLAHGMSLATLAKAAALAGSQGVDAATALLNAGLVSEDAYYRALAAALGAPFLPGPMPLGDGARFPESLVAGVAPLAPGAGPTFVLAPRGAAIVELLAGKGPAGRTPAITTPSALRHAIFACRGPEIAAHAAETLHASRPDWSHRTKIPAPRLAIAGLIAATACALACLAPAPALAAAWAIAQAGFLAMVTFRIAALSMEERREEAAPAPLEDRDLPAYTVIVALHREAPVVDRLILGLARLDYPASKLDIKIVIEEGDAETAAALARVPFPPRFEVLTAPPGHPRAKPRALNVALPLARGGCLVVFDAEDVPDPGQLRLAAALFARASPSTACLQGRLVIDNARDTILTRFFALEYAALFDVLIPALAAWRLPVPLGGTSTHFRTRILREVGGWDAWNVTEDADLGIRLARAGYHVGDLPSATMEEAPIAAWPWLRQRARWMKGFLQTSLTHGRHPARAWRDLGPLGACCAIALVPGTVISALAYPFVMIPALVAFLGGEVFAGTGFWATLPTGTAITVFASGFAAMIAPAIMGCARRRWWGLMALAPLLPLYFCLVSLGAWLGLIELFTAPARWNKTTHGLSRTSRSGALPRSLRRPAPHSALASSAALCSGGRARFRALMKRLRPSMM